MKEENLENIVNGLWVNNTYNKNWFRLETERPLNDEEILERMDIAVIENFIRRKKLESLKIS